MRELEIQRMRERENQVGGTRWEIQIAWTKWQGQRCPIGMREGVDRNNRGGDENNRGMWEIPVHGWACSLDGMG